MFLNETFRVDSLLGLEKLMIFNCILQKRILLTAHVKKN